MSIVDDVRGGRARVEWADVVSQREDGTALRITVMRDALKVDGVRVAASARDLQTIADMLGCLLLTPKVIDLIYQQAALRFDPVVRADGNIVAYSTSKRVSALIDAAIASRGGDPGGLIDSIGKYWVLHKHLQNVTSLRYGKATVCNYGWLSESGYYPAETKGLKCWQNPGFQHDDSHVDPSQVIRLMKRKAVLLRPCRPDEEVDLVDVLQDPDLAGLVTYDGPLTYLRVADVPPPEPADPIELLPYDA